MKEKKMPTMIFLMVLSLITVLIGFLSCVYILVIGFAHSPINSIIKSFLILFVSLLVAGVVRMIGVIGQVLMDLKAERIKFLDELSLMNYKLERMNCDSKDINQSLQEMNCDSKDINQNLKHLNAFFTKIANHLGV